MAGLRTVCSLTELECKALLWVIESALDDVDEEGFLDGCLFDEERPAVVHALKRAVALVRDGAHDSDDDTETYRDTLAPWESGVIGPQDGGDDDR